MGTCQIVASEKYDEYLPPDTHTEHLPLKNISHGLGTLHVALSFFKIILKVYLFLTVLGLCCCTVFSLVGERGLLFIALHRLLIAMACFVSQHRLRGTQLHVGSMVAAPLL